MVIEDLKNSNLSDRINKLMFEFEDVDKIKVTSNHFEKIIVNRKTQPYLKAINIAKMLILNYSPNISSGNENMLTLLFDMNKLWEEYIYRILQKNKPQGYKVSYQNSDKFWENKKIKPDIVITDSNGENFVIDTKWKLIYSNKPSDDDLKQMFVYNLHWKSKRSMLLYPQIDQRDSSFGNYKFKIDNQENQCKLGFVSVLENGKIKNSKTLFQEIFDKMI